MNTTQEIHVKRIDESIQQIELYIRDVRVKAVVSALETIKTDAGAYQQLVEALDELGPVQGAVLTYE